MHRNLHINGGQMKRTRDGIIAEVMAVIALVRGANIKTPPLTMDTQLVQDLHLEHDTSDIILMLQDRTGIKPPKQGWRNARTIGDIVELLLKYAPETSAEGTA